MTKKERQSPSGTQIDPVRGASALLPDCLFQMLRKEGRALDRNSEPHHLRGDTNPPGPFPLRSYPSPQPTTGVATQRRDCAAGRGHPGIGAQA
jgi:hypothetical protein